MKAVLDLRVRYKERFEEVHRVPLGIVSFFARASVLALREFPRLNAFIEGEDIEYHQYVHLCIAVSTDRGLVVPVLRNAERMSLSDIEAGIKRVANAARAGTLSVEDLSGGTFTLTKSRSAPWRWMTGWRSVR